jgi:putative Ca2+/H+ antiporter (TMEM165/GDT1 family)
LKLLQEILIPFIVVGLAELGDKTQLFILLLATKTEAEKHIQLFLGTMLAFLIVDGIAIVAGGCVTHVASEELIKTLSSAVFIVFGLLLLFRNEKEGAESRHHPGNPFYSGFILIFVSEWGDKTQIATGLFATRYNSLMVLIGVMMALGLLSAIAIYSGKFISDKVNKETITKIAGLSFILMGVGFFLS